MCGRRWWLIALRIVSGSAGRARSICATCASACTPASVRPALGARHVGWYHHPLDVAAMQAGAATLVGTHDFSAFRAAECQAKSPVKTLDALDITRDGEEIHIAAHARSFLHHQVRNMAGTLKLVGLGSWQPADVATALAARDRRAGGPTAPAEGLTLVAIDYGGA